MEFEVKKSKEADKYLKKLQPKQIDLIQEAIKQLAEDPLANPNTIHLKHFSYKGYDKVYRCRQGDYRILFTIDKEVSELIILAIKPRGQAYKKK